MAQPQVFDYAAMHRVGYASASGTRRYKPQRQTSALERFAFQFIGSQVIDYANSARERRQGYQEKNENFSEIMAATIAEDEFTGNSDVADAIQEFSTMRDEGQRLVSKYHGFVKSKKYKKGVAMMNESQSKLKNLQTSMQNRLTFNNNLKSVTLNGYYIDAEGNKVQAELDDKANKDKVTNRGLASMNGDLDKSIRVNRVTGFLEVHEEDWDDVSVMPGSVGLEQVVDPKIIITPWNELKLPKFRDPSGASLSTDASAYGTGIGKDGISWDNTIEAGVHDMAKQKVDGLSRTGFNSWFFNGTHYDFASGGKTFTTPAEAFIKEKYPSVYEKMKEGDEAAKTQYLGILESLKDQDLSEIEGYKEFAINHYVEVAKQYHGISKATYDKEHRKTSKVVKQTKWEYEVQRDTDKAVAMMSGENTQYDTLNGKDYEFRSDGKGYTKIFIKQKMEKEGEAPTFKYVPFGDPMYTEDALKFRGLDHLIPPEYMPLTVEERVAKQHEDNPYIYRESQDKKLELEEGI